MSLGQGNISINQKKEPAPGPPGPPFLLTSADNGLSVDPVTGRIVLGQAVGAVGNPAQFLSSREIPMAGFDFTMIDAGFLLPIFWISPPTGFFLLGDALGSSLSIANNSSRTVLGNGPGAINATHLVIDDTIQSAEIKSNGSRHLQIDQPGGIYQFGDIDGVGTGMKITIADFIPTFFISDTIANYFNINPPNLQFNLDTTVGVLLQGDGLSGLMNLVAPNGITTSDPGTGSGAWRLGQIKAGAVVFDATRSVEINISGTVVKLAIAI